MNDPLFGNKLAGAVLTSALIFFGLPQLNHALVESEHLVGHDGELHLAYPIEFETAGGGEEGGEEVQVASLGERLAAASATGGERRAALCKSCHSFEEGGANGAGPNLWNIIGRPVASVAGFNYTGALKDFGGEWTYDRLDKYLENSQGYIAGTAMVQRFPKPEHRADLLAYLQTLSSAPVPFPAPEQRDADAGGESELASNAE